jgi:hypothetical protein
VSAPGAHDFVAATIAAFAQALTQTDVTTERWYSLAAGRVHVQYAGNALARRFDRALAPFAAEPTADPGLQLVCWDRTTVDVVPPAPPWSAADLLPRHRIRGFDRDGVRATYDASRGILQLYDPVGRAVYFAQDCDRVPPWAVRAPFRSVVGWWAADRGLAVVHASAVGDDRGCVLITGPSGSGKSTTALACVERGLRLLTDDVAIVALDPVPVAFASSSIAKVEAGSLVDVGHLDAPVAWVAAEQTMLDLGDRILASAPVRAVIAAEVGEGARSSVRRLTPGQCLRALAGHSVVEALSGDRRSLSALRELSRRVPAHTLTLGTDLDGVVALVRRILVDAT